ncbi:MAG TPA: helix-turn-helix transcriptional regulator [Clostridiales bacterium]|jgi:transcriptional regulator with XRE-family HTH domain|nr:helix-turn-helix transcriptional regulator [Clostridiales bacterium]
MILADKIILLRKKNGWSQEELASKLQVSRQAISKWEGAQSTPDLDRILAMSTLFGVSTDVLMKDELELTDSDVHTDTDDTSLRKVSMEEANEMMALKLRISRPIAFGVMLCVLAGAVITLFGGLFENTAYASLGVIIGLVLVACAVALFIVQGQKTKPYEWMESTAFETAYGVDGMVRERKNRYASQHTSNIAVGVVLCILGVISFVSTELFADLLQLKEVFFVAFGLTLVAFACYLFVSSGIIWGSFQQLLQEEDYTPEKKRVSKKAGPLYGVYWLTVTALFLAYSFITQKWDRSWIVWPVAGVCFGIYAVVVQMIVGKKS